MAVEQAIIALVIEGSAEVSAEADRIVVKLESVQSAGKSAESAAQAAETAAKDAEEAAKALSSEIAKTFRALSRAARMAKKLVHGMGVEKYSKTEAAIDILASGLKGAAMGARLGSVVGPWGTAIGAGVGAIYGEYTAYTHDRDRILEHNKKLEEHAQKHAKKEEEERILEELLRQVGLYKLDQHHFGPRQVP
jgi:uncharacterized membrane protein